MTLPVTQFFYCTEVASTNDAVRLVSNVTSVQAAGQREMQQLQQRRVIECIVDDTDDENATDSGAH